MRYGVTYYKLEARYLDHERICISTNVAVDIHFYGLTILHGRRTSITPLAPGCAYRPGFGICDWFQLVLVKLIMAGVAAKHLIGLNPRNFKIPKTILNSTNFQHSCSRQIDLKPDRASIIDIESLIDANRMRDMDKLRANSKELYQSSEDGLSIYSLTVRGFNFQETFFESSDT